MTSTMATVVLDYSTTAFYSGIQILSCGLNLYTVLTPDFLQTKLQGPFLLSSQGDLVQSRRATDSLEMAEKSLSLTKPLLSHLFSPRSPSHHHIHLARFLSLYMPILCLPQVLCTFSSFCLDHDFPQPPQSLPFPVHSLSSNKLTNSNRITCPLPYHENSCFCFLHNICKFQKGPCSFIHLSTSPVRV